MLVCAETQRESENFLGCSHAFTRGVAASERARGLCSKPQRHQRHRKALDSSFDSATRFSQNKDIEFYSRSFSGVQKDETHPSKVLRLTENRINPDTPASQPRLPPARAGASTASSWSLALIHGSLFFLYCAAGHRIRRLPLFCVSRVSQV